MALNRMAPLRRTKGLTRRKGLTRTPIKSRSAPLRRTALKSAARTWHQASGLKRTAWRLRAVSPRRAPMVVKRSNTGPSPKVRGIVRGRSGGLCEHPHCGRRAVHTHHRRPRGAGGDPRPETNLASNLIHLCWRHHMWIESHRDAAEVFGLLMAWNTPDPSKVPVVLRYHTGPVRLDNEGGWTRVD